MGSAERHLPRRAELGSAAAAKPLAELERLLASASTDERSSTLGTQLNAALRGAARIEQRRALADLLVKSLDAKRFGDLADESGTTCREVAIETLIQLGYPYALEVSPEDLEYLRTRRGPAWKKWARWAPALVFPAAAAQVALQPLAYSPSTVVAAGASTLAAIALVPRLGKLRLWASRLMLPLGATAGALWYLDGVAPALALGAT